MSITYCFHCINTCKTPGVKKDCSKYKTQNIDDYRKELSKSKLNPERRKELQKIIDYIDFGVSL